jgi:hypothetical protein
MRRTSATCMRAPRSLGVSVEQLSGGGSQPTRAPRHHGSTPELSHGLCMSDIPAAGCETAQARSVSAWSFVKLRL